MIGTEMVDRPLDRTPTPLLVRQLFQTRVRSPDFPIEARHFVRKPGVEFHWITFRMIRESVENAPRLVENGTLDSR